MSIADNVARVRERISAAAQRTRRHPDDIELMAVTKTVSAEWIRETYGSGIRLFGENRVQEFEGKQAGVRELSDARWHMIGHLQTNKAGRATELFACVESVDSLRLAQKLNSAAAAIGKTLPILIEINIGGEGSKGGIAPGSENLEHLLEAAPALSQLRLQGLMSVPPYNDDPELARFYFRQMRELSDEIRSRNLAAVKMDVLSMGMSHDFEIAIQEGATRVRVGTAIFGEREVVRGKN